MDPPGVSMKRRSTPSLENILCTGQEDDGEDKEERSRRLEDFLCVGFRHQRRPQQRRQRRRADDGGSNRAHPT